MGSIYLSKHSKERCDILKANESITYNYTGKCQKITLEPGTYRFECYGGKGGGSNGANGNKTVGYYKINISTDFYLWIGGQSTSGTGGWNGGQNVSESGVYGGGGATDISLNGIDGSTDWNNANHINSRIIMAKGGNGQGKTGGTTQGTATRTSADAWTEYIDRSGVQAMELTPTVNGTLTFWSYAYATDPWGYIDRVGYGTIGSNDDGGYGLNFHLSVSIVAGQKYILRVGAFSRAGSCNWRATYPDSNIKLYTVVTSGGTGGGSDYFASTIKDTSKSENINNDNGKIIITRIGRQIITTNCAVDITSVIGGETVTLNVPDTLLINGYPQGFTRFSVSYNKIDIIKYNSKYIFTVPLEMDIELKYKEPLYIEAIFKKIRTNSNYYKDSYYQEHFDFNKLIGGD